MEHFTLYVFVLFTLLGLAIGSFLNVVIARLPVMLQRDWLSQCQAFLQETCKISVPDLDKHQLMQQQDKPFNIAYPRSQCPSCHQVIRAIDNIPVLSFLLLKGRCRHCQSKISIRYPAIELMTACLTVFVYWHYGLANTLLPVLVLTWSLIALTWIDIDKQILPDNITLPLLWLGLLLNIQAMFCPLNEAILGAIVGYMSLWSLYWLFKLLTGKEGMGYGDFKLMAMLGAWLGVKNLLPIILISSMVGAVVGIALILLKIQSKDRPIPFGPFIASAGWLTLIWGEDLINAYLRFSGLTV